LIGMLEACERLLTVEEAPPADPPATPVPTVVAGYEVRGELGCGGAGVVYRVWDPVLRREAALKMLRPSGLAALPAEAARLSRRFQQEAQVLARLKHEHIVPVFEARVEEGQPYFVMECVPDGSLAPRRPQMTAVGPKVIVPFMEKVARAVHYAHENGVLHRDLKPANILLDWRPDEGKLPVPRVSDFGLAKLLAGEADDEAITVVSPLTTLEPQPPVPDVSRLTASGFQPGTPAYMAPEQIDPGRGAIGPATDIWALGVILYELLTGQKPFTAGTQGDLRERVCRGAPPPPRTVRPNIPRRLEAIVLRCLAKEPGRRFGSAREVADQLARYHRSTRWRAPVLGILVGLVVLTAGTLWTVRESSPERRYERRVAPLLAQLQRGEAVDLIQPGGEAPAFMIRSGEGITKARMTENGFIVTTPTGGIVELLPRVPVSHYRIEAELRHDRTWFGSVPESGVGVTFTSRHIPSPDGVQHVVGAVVLNDWDNVSDMKMPGKEEREKRAKLQLIWYVDTLTDGRSPFTPHLCSTPNGQVAYKGPADPQSFHTLQIEIHPEGTTAILGDAPETTMGPLPPDLFSWFGNSLRAKHEEVRGVDLDPLNNPTIGLVVRGGQCTIRRLRIIPAGNAVR
jgi:serine/threonine protein kinase